MMGGGPGPEAAKQAQILMLHPPSTCFDADKLCPFYTLVLSNLTFVSSLNKTFLQEREQNVNVLFGKIAWGAKHIILSITLPCSVLLDS